MSRVGVYVDGFNLYHGIKEMASHDGLAGSWKWLDLRALSRRLVPRDEVVQLRYFTARVRSVEADDGIAVRQQAYVRALETISEMTVHYGSFQTQKKRMPLVEGLSPGRRRLVRKLGLNLREHDDGAVTVRVWKVEEKGSDVNLATYLLVDAFHDVYDKALVFSNDTDLCEPIRFVVGERHREVVVVNPRGHRRPAAELAKVASATRGLRMAAVTSSQFPDVIQDAHGHIRKPSGW
jgi:hypothetical protein